MVSSLLEKLPGELRNRIYEFALNWPEPIAVQLSTGRPQLFHNRDLRNALAFSSVCKQMRHDCMPIFYGTNDFVVALKRPYGQHPSDSRKLAITKWQRALRLWLASIKYEEYRHLTHLTIDMGTLVANGDCTSSARLWRSVADMLPLFHPERTTVSLITVVLWRYRPRWAFKLSLPLTNIGEARWVVMEALAAQRLVVDDHCIKMGVAAINASYTRIKLETCGQELLSLVSIIASTGVNGG